MVANYSLEGQLVTSSSELNSNDFQILAPADKNLIVVKSKLKVGVFCSKTTRLVTSLFKDESVLCIWLQNGKLGSDGEIVCGLSQSGFVLESTLESAKFDEPEKKTKLPSFVQVPSNVCFARPLTNQRGELDTVYYVTKESDSNFSLVSKSVATKKNLKFGQVSQSLGHFMFAFNEVFLVKAGDAVSGKSGAKLTFHCTSAGNRPWFHTIARDRKVTSIACHPAQDRVGVTGDSTGRIQIWRQKGDFQFFLSELHWHSLPVRTLSFSPEGVYFFSGGGEGAVLKWELVSGRRVALVPRLGSNVTSMVASHSSVVVSLENNVIKIFTANLDDDQMITGLSKETQDSGIFWHPQTRSVVLKAARRRIQFFDPLLKTQKLALDASNQDDVLGDRDVDQKSVSKLSLFTMSACGNWMATVESNWDTMNGNCLKIWNFTNQDPCSKFQMLVSESSQLMLLETILSPVTLIPIPNVVMAQSGQISFDLNTRINGAHDGDINSVSFVVLRNTIGLVTCGNEGKAKLWELGDRAMWTPVRTFSHVGCVPRCVDASHDASVIGVAFDSKITLWSSELLSLLSTLSTTSDESKEDYKDLVFGPGHLLLAANNSAIHVWSLLTNQLTYKMSLSHPKLVKTPKSIMIASSSGVFNLDDKMKTTCLTRKSAHLSSLACSENHCFVVGRTPDKEDNDLFSLAMESSSSNISENGETALERSDATTSQLSLMTSSLSRVKLSRTDDIHAPKLGPTLTASMISAPASKSCLSILKQSLPA